MRPQIAAATASAGITPARNSKSHLRFRTAAQSQLSAHTATAMLQKHSVMVKAKSMGAMRHWQQQQSRRRNRAPQVVCSLKGQQAAFDPMLVGGDVFILLSMQMSSETLPVQNTGVVSILLLTTWIAVAAAKRDYSLDNVSYDAWSVYEPVMTAVKSTAITWALFAPVAAMLYGALLNQGLLVVPSATAADTSYLVSHPVGLWATGNKMDISTPEIEVLWAALFCLTSWRAFYSAFRAWSNLM
mmetsp:Transcript_14844/g.44839  ORF Transcript_14844/g.44839 Transcript_14844/m.44839 type:complete len:243 (-) Transcript_14844:951-1679(-)